MTPTELISFENEIVELYESGKIRSPVHLSGGNEEELIKIFKKVKPNDWIFTTYRSHYHALLKGMPKEELKKWILENKSIHLMSNEYLIVSSALVGGCLSQAVGVAMAIKRRFPKSLKSEKFIKEKVPHVWCFIGDMTASLGIFKDCHTYAYNHHLPITFVVEDNNMSTDTPTKKPWKKKGRWWFDFINYENIIYYKYERNRPHYGTGKFVEFEDKT